MESDPSVRRTRTVCIANVATQNGCAEHAAILRQIGIAEWVLDCFGYSAISRAAELGFSSIHLDYGRPGTYGCLDNHETRSIIVRTASQEKLRIGALVLNILNELPLISPPAICNCAIDGAIEAAREMSVPLIILPSFGSGQICGESGLREAAWRLKRACDGLPSDTDIVVATENSLGIDGNRRLAALVDQPGFRILFDTQNPLLFGHDPVSLLREFMPILASDIHVKDGTDGQMGNAPLGTGMAQLDRTLAVLQRMTFSGMFILENEYADVASGTRCDLAKLLALLRRAKSEMER